MKTIQEIQERGLQLNKKTGTYYEDMGNEYRNEDGNAIFESDVIQEKAQEVLDTLEDIDYQTSYENGSLTRIIYTEKYKIEQAQLNNGVWVPIRRWNLKTGKREL